MGGLTVLSALRRVLPHENLLYLGDTARLPYGTKSSDTVVRYAVQAAGRLVEQQVKMLVIACNTATAAALGALRQEYPQVTVVGVIEPGAEAAVRASRSGHIAVIATEGTIKNGAYTKAIKEIAQQSKVTGIPCPLFVSLAEEGWTGDSGRHDGQERTDVDNIELEGNILQTVAERYLRSTFPSPEKQTQEKGSDCQQAPSPDCLLLGCTHFPPLAPAIAKVVGPEVALVDSAATTATVVAELLSEQGLMRSHTTGDATGQWHFLTTDSPERFRRVGSLFLGTHLEDSDVELVVL